MGQMNGAMAPESKLYSSPRAGDAHDRLFAGQADRQMGGDITLFIPREAQDVIAAALKKA